MLAAMALLVTAVSAGELFPDKGVKMIYTMYCAECHGGKAEGSTEGPPLIKIDFLKSKDIKSIEKIINTGVDEKAKRFNEEEMAAIMPGFSEDLTKEEIEKLTRLVKSWNM